MKFSNPAFLWALFSLAIPIIIHLFHFRKFKTVYFTNVRFLISLQKETQSRSKLKHILILIARCLALAALVIAFARPFIPSVHKAKTGSRAISIYIDNSFSMNGKSETATLLEMAKKHAASIASSYKETDRFQLITNDFEGKHQRLLSKDQFIEMLREVDLSASFRKTSEIIARQNELFDYNKIQNPISFLISDFQSGAADIEQAKADTTVQLNLIHLQNRAEGNISLDSLWFETPYRQKSASDRLFFSVRNHAKQRAENITASVTINQLQKGISSFSAGADSSKIAEMNFSNPESGYQFGSLSINDHPIIFDDRFYFSYNVPEKLNILVVQDDGGSNYLEKIYGKNPAFNLTSVTSLQLDYSKFPKYNLIVLNGLKEISSGTVQEISKFIREGGSLAVFPSLQADLSGYTSLCQTLNSGGYGAIKELSQRVGNINFRHPIYDDVFERVPQNIDLPSVKKYFSITSGSKNSSEEIMRLPNGDLFASSFDSGKGKVYLFCTELDETGGNFQQHALFVPTLYKIGLYSFPNSKLYYTLGKNEAIILPGLAIDGDKTLKLKSEDGTFEIIPEQEMQNGTVKLYGNNELPKAGNYKIMVGDSIKGWASFNYPREESKMKFENKENLLKRFNSAGFTTLEILDGNLKELEKSIAQLDEGKPIWKYFILAALLFFLIEILLIRFMKS
jgi:hypothetical protein